MCELFALSSSKPASVTYSLREFALHGGKTYKNNSGWGIAYFKDRDAMLVKEAEPASDSPWVDFIANQAIESSCVIAHVRLATIGTPTLQNTHPFRRALGRHTHVFAHNGTLHGLHDKYSSDLLVNQPLGDTDSELAFCLLIERLTPIWTQSGKSPSIAQRLDVFSDFACEMASYGSANFLYSDGDVLFVHAHRRIYEEDNGFSDPRPPGLSMRSCMTCQESPEWGVQGCHVALADQQTILLASVPLDESGWEPLPEGVAIALCEGREVGRIATV